MGDEQPAAARPAAGVRLRTWPARTLAVLALLAGLFAMHGLAGAHAGMSPLMPAEAMSDTASDAANTGTGMMLEEAPRTATSAALVTQTSRHEAAPLTRLSAPGTATDGAGQHSMGAVCLAVLTAALLLLVLHRQGTLRWATTPTRAALALLHVPALPRPPPDLQRLCISRT